jgi:hypothetical protein
MVVFGCQLYGWLAWGQGLRGFWTKYSPMAAFTSVFHGVPEARSDFRRCPFQTEAGSFCRPLCKGLDNAA